MKVVLITFLRHSIPSTLLLLISSFRISRTHSFTILTVTSVDWYLRLHSFTATSVMENWPLISLAMMSTPRPYSSPTTISLGFGIPSFKVSCSGNPLLISLRIGNRQNRSRLIWYLEVMLNLFLMDWRVLYSITALVLIIQGSSSSWEPRVMIIIPTQITLHGQYTSVI